MMATIAELKIVPYRNGWKVFMGKGKGYQWVPTKDGLVVWLDEYLNRIVK